MMCYQLTFFSDIDTFKLFIQKCNNTYPIKLTILFSYLGVIHLVPGIILFPAFHPKYIQRHIKKHENSQ